MGAMEETVQNVLKQLYDLDHAVQVSRPEPAFGDYATNVALQIAKQVGKAPRDVAQEVAEALRQTGEFSEVSIAGPGFINVRVAPAKLISRLNEVWTDRYGSSEDGAGKTVVVEYPSPNMAKPYSVGHLRPGNQGWAARRLMEETGWRVITDNHLGDYGAPLGIWITGFLRFSSDSLLAEKGVYELGRVYIAMKKALKEEAASGAHELADEVQSWLLRFESGDAEAMAYSQRFNEISLRHIHEVMGRLKIATDYELGEAFFAPQGKAAVQKLLQTGVAIQNEDGSVIVPLEEFGFDVPLLVQKSNGAALYATTDLATILYRENEWHPDRVIYAVGAEQQFYFSQLFAMAKKLGIKTELIHLWFGAIDQLNEDGLRERMSSRKGVVLMEDLLNQAEAKAQSVVEGREVAEDDVKRIALGAVKFSDFTADRRTNILFDWDSIFALTGFSGPYVQYAAVRVNKILQEHGTGTMLVQDYDYAAEKAVVAKLIEYPEVVRVAARDLEPHKVASYLYELAREMNRYYEATPVATGGVDETQKQARLGVLAKVSHVFTHGLSILGIEVPTAM
ncbi:arginine--tRNA ligase [Candidatus Saccharibacteria bacterium]|nr:arginine--tRNA ligase [Candidatus Saccharibacteria bacterium]MBQ69530.1 arginine--tRNA ligase [Candidatus Saccharibacteria bacterium]|tara:strand:- start:192 stop:1886 length:1695 start_codon:yes stop_codon:yes gene_type:complete